MTPDQLDLLRRWGSQMGARIDDQAIERLERYVALLDTWNRRIRLTGERDIDVVVEKHLPDCLTLAPFLEGEVRAVDVGTGAGFPGAVVACVSPGATITLVESRRRPASFLREASRDVPLPNVLVVEDRWEDWASRSPASVDLVTGRAIRLEILLAQADLVLKPGGVVVGMQSVKPSRAELATLAQSYRLWFVEAREYELPSGEPRQLVVFGRS